jgi:hypothetical protein
MSSITHPPGADLRHMQRGARWAALLMLLLLWSQSAVRTRITALPKPPPPSPPVWGEKPVLGYFVFTASIADLMREEAGLSQDQFTQLEHIAAQEMDALDDLEQESLPIVQSQGLSLEQKGELIKEMRYNERALEAVRQSQTTIRSEMGPVAYRRIANWIEDRWKVEKELRSSARLASGPRTYRIFATRYDSGGAYTVALPDKCLKFANAGNSLCNGDGYIAGYGYTVYISYESAVAVPVGESGPWNVDDNFWATTGDPTPRRMFADLALGMPEAQAAYFNGYNGGVDQFGRVVTAPFGIDLARQVSIDIGLEPGKNDWIDVSFLWTDGWDGSSGAPAPNPGETAAPQPTVATIIPVQLATPGADGALVHTVQEGQTLWNIASAYQVNLQVILGLNGLNDGSVIHPGDELLIQDAGSTLTPTASQTYTPTLTQEATTPEPTHTLVPATSTSTAVAVSTITSTVTPSEKESVEPPSQAFDPILAGIAAIGVVGAVLFVIGQGLGRKKNQ